jgi:hypothetical protein
MLDESNMDDNQADDGSSIRLTHSQLMDLITKTQGVPQPKAPKPQAASPFQAQQPPQRLPGVQAQFDPQRPVSSLDPNAYAEPTQMAQARTRIAAMEAAKQQSAGGANSPATMSAQDAWKTLTEQNPKATTQQKWATIQAMAKTGVFKTKAAAEGLTGVEGALYQDAIKRGMSPTAAAEEAAKYKRAGSAEVAATELAKKEADTKAKTEANQPKAKQTMERMTENADDMKNALAAIRKQSGAWTTGMFGKLFSALPGTEAYNLHANLERLTSRLGLDTLQEIKDSSPNGSALGRVTNYEMGLLVKAKENLDQAQSEDQFNAALDDLETKIANSKKHIQAAYEETYGKGGESAQGGGLSPTEQSRLQELRAKYGIK